MAVVSVEWLEAAPEGASFSYTSEESTSFWVKTGEAWQGSRAKGQPVIATITTQDLIDNLGAYDRAALKVENEGKLPEPAPEPPAPAEEPEEDPVDLDDPEPEAEPEEPEAEVSTEADEQEAPAPEISPERLRGLRALILSRKDPVLVERFRKDYAAFSEGKTQADVDALIAG